MDGHFRAVTKLMVLTISLTCSIWFAGCTRVVHEPVMLPTIARPTLPAVSGAELQCLAPDTYTKIVDRERGYKTWGLKLEAIIGANNAKAKP